MMQAMELGKFVIKFDDLVGPFITNLFFKDSLTAVYSVSI